MIATAYEREQDILRRSIAALNSLVETQTELNVALRDALKNANQRTDAALRRIEQLERDVALDRSEAIKSEKRIEQLELEVEKLKGPASITMPAGTVIDTEALARGHGKIVFYAPDASPLERAPQCGVWACAACFDGRPCPNPPLPDEGT